MKKLLTIALLAGLFSAQPAFAGFIYWVDWTSAINGFPGSATGTISIGGGTHITVNYGGDVTFAQTGSGTNYWTEGTPKPYTGNPVVDNAPTASEMIALSGSGILNTITFSQAIENPIMAIVSMGRTNLPVSYDFNIAFTVLGEGKGYWGDGWYELLPGDILKGYELHGVIQFNGMLSSISWIATPGEYWHGITVGLPEQTPIPEPSTFFMLGAGLLGLIGYAYKRKKS